MMTSQQDSRKDSSIDFNYKDNITANSKSQVIHITFYVSMPLTSAEACEKTSRWLWKERLC